MGTGTLETLPWDNGIGGLTCTTIYILTSMCVCVFVRGESCEPQFLHPQKGNNNPTFLTGVKRLKREHAIQSLGII